MKLVSWNVNGIRAAVKNGLGDYLQSAKPDIIGLQEIKISDDARAQHDFPFVGYEEYWHSAQRPGYSGTVILVKSEKLPSSAKASAGKKAISYRKGFNDDGNDDNEGRLQTLEFDKFYFVNCYFPNSNHELSRLQFKEEFNAKFLEHIKKLDKKKPVIACGDYNVAHNEIDLKNPKENIGNAGFTSEERVWMDKFLAAGFVDTFRYLHPEEIKYSWWSYRFGARRRNIGWRIDYFLVSPALVKKIKKAEIFDDISGSDHCPIGIEINF